MKYLLVSIKCLHVSMWLWTWGVYMSPYVSMSAMSPH